MALTELLRDQHLDGFADQFRARVSEELLRADIDLMNGAFVVGHDDRVGRMFKKCLEKWMSNDGGRADGGTRGGVLIGHDNTCKNAGPRPYYSPVNNLSTYANVEAWKPKLVSDPVAVMSREIVARC